MARRSISLAVHLALASAAVVSSGVAAAQQGPPTDAPAERLGIVVSGGVSEGAYQAGVMYALLRYLVLHRVAGPGYPTRLAGPNRARAPAAGLGSDPIPNFTVAAGSSAGNINSFLAALTWCQADPAALRPRENLFWDSWINVGWDTLSPADPRGAAYKKLFLDPLSTGDFRKLDLAAIFAAWNDDRSVYSTADGLVTRAAFAVVDQNLQRHLQVGTYRDCVVRVGLTATRAQAGYLRLGPADNLGAPGRDGQQEVRADRFVVPLLVETAGRISGAATGAARPAAPVRINNLTDESMAPVGLSMALPLAAAGSPLVPASAVLKLVEASSAFPIAFGPVLLPHCRRERPDTPPAGDVVCPPGWTGTKAAFIDGGIFDNQPFGLAYHLAEDGGQAPILLYVDTQPVRHDLVGLQGRAAENGIGLAVQLLKARVGEARGYENLAAATERATRLHAERRAQSNPLAQQTEYRTLRRDLEDRPPQLSSRFFPIVGNRLVDSFAAFMHPSFRVHDYFVGVYDGIFTIAQALELDRDELRRPVSERRLPTTTTFFNVARELIGADADLKTFVWHLFEYERYWTGVAGVQTGDGKYCSLALTNPGSRETDREDVHVAQVFNVLCELDNEARTKARAGNVVSLTQYMKNTSGLAPIIDRLPEPLIGDRHAWEFAVEDRIVRRAIDVERAVHRSQGTSRQVEYLALTSRYFAAAGFEREREIVDLDPSSVARISGGHWGIGRTFWHIFPYYVSWDPVRSRVSTGWEPKLRFWLADTSLYVTAGADLGLYTHALGRPVDDGKPTKFELRAPIGLGWDPKLRLLDDVQLAATFSSPLAEVTSGRWLGLELAAHPLGSKFRVAVGFPQFLWSRDGLPDLASRFSAWYLGIAVSDLNGSLYWAVRSATGAIFSSSCEEYCDGVTE